MHSRIQEWQHAIVLLILVAPALHAQPETAESSGMHGKVSHLDHAQAFTFVRVEWNGVRMAYGLSGFGRGPLWAHDYPVAEQNFYVALDAMTHLPLTFESKILRLDNDEIFDFPFLYICEVGYWVPNEEELSLLSEYLKRGGFLLVDDFRGGFEWRSFLQEMKQITPYKPRDLSLDHPIFHCFFEFSDLGEHSPYWGLEPHYYAIFDQEERMMVLINFNNDIGDGWEWPESDRAFSTEAFKLGINYLIYSMTH